MNKQLTQKQQDAMEIMAVMTKMVISGLSDEEIQAQLETELNTKMSQGWINKISQIRAIIS